MTDSTERDAGSAVDGAGTRRNAVFVVTALGAFMGSLDLSIVNVAFPALERSFPHDPRSTLSWVIIGYGIVFGSLLVIAGRTADRLGSRKVFFAGLGVFCLGSALCGIAPSVELLVAGRVVQGAGAAALLPASLSLLLATFPPERRSQVVALWGGVGALAVATGPSVGALLISAGGWRLVFYVNVPIGAVAWLVGRRVLAEAKAGVARPQPDYLGVVLVSTSLAALVLGISQGPTWGWSDGRIIGSFAAAIVLGAAFLRRSAHHPEPVLDLTLFRSRSFSVANTATLFYAMGFFAMLLGNILFLTSVWHYSILQAGLAVTPGPLVVAAVSGPAGKLAGRIGFRRVLLAGFTVFVIGLCWYALRVGLHSDYVGQWLEGTLISGLGIGLTFPVLSAAAVSSLHPERFAVGSAVNQTARQIGGAFGVALLVVILGTPSGTAQALTHFRHLWLYAAAMAALAGVLCAFLGNARAPRQTAVLAATAPLALEGSP
ncbi:MAG TPA: DHA2 family efflux MFS transporter permease subunit [Acidimicrobiales bacterium]|jgi:EmrB/QacA subfamily drug resistance transporter|nr:DHA2 family efflux MFS transporter permease subunit [Acidimicrobiales bacterium]